MTRRRKVPSGGPFEEIVGYSRAVAAGDFIFVSGCTSIVDGEVTHEGDMARQAEQAVLTAGAAAGAATVVPTWMSVGETPDPGGGGGAGPLGGAAAPDLPSSLACFLRTPALLLPPMKTATSRRVMMGTKSSTSRNGPPSGVMIAQRM